MDAFPQDPIGPRGVHPFGPGPKAELPRDPGSGPGLGGVLSVFPASSALAKYPSPFSETRTAETRDVMRRTYSRASASATSSDRIARNFTPTAMGLTMRTLVQRLANPVIGLAGNGGGVEVQTKPKLLASDSEHKSESSSSQLRTITVSRRGGSGQGVLSNGLLSPNASVPGPRSVPLGMADSDDPVWRPLTELELDAKAHEEELKRRYTFDKVTRGMVHAREIQLYWNLILSDDGRSFEHRAEWDESILTRLEHSTAPLQGRRWQDPSLMVPVELLERYGPLAFHPQPPSHSPSERVEEMFSEIYSLYATAVRKAEIDYLLLDPNAALHRGLTRHIVDDVRYLSPGITTREKIGIAFTAHPLGLLAATRQLHAMTEPMQVRLLSLWVHPKTPGSLSFANTRLTDFGSREFAEGLPYTSDDFTAAVESSIGTALGVLKDQWHKEASEIVASFILDAQEHERRAAQALAAVAGSAGPIGGDKKMRLKEADDNLLLAIDPLVRDFVLAGVAVLRARRYAAGAAPRQEFAISDAPANADLTTFRSPGATDLSPESDIYLHAGPAPKDPVLYTVARAATGASLQLSRPSSQVATRRHGSSGVAAAKAAAEEAAAAASAAAESVVANLAGILPGNLQEIGFGKLEDMLLQAYTGLEGKEVRQARRLQSSFSAAAVLMGSCIRSTVYAAIDDYSSFLRRYIDSVKPVVEAIEESSLSDNEEEEKKAEFASSEGTSVTSSLLPGQFINVHEPISPLIKMSISIEFGTGSSNLDDGEFDEEGGKKRHGGNEKKPKASAAGEKKEEKKDISEAEKAAIDALEAAANNEVIEPVAPTPADELRRVWAGEVHFTFEPSWESIRSTLTQNLETIVQSCATLPRVESVLASSAGVATVISHISRASGSAGIHLSPLSSVRLSDDRNGQLEDEAITRARKVVIDVVEVNRPAPDSLLKKFDSYMSVFSASLKRKLVALVIDPATGSQQIRDELKRLDEIALSVSGVCEPVLSLGLVEVDARPLQDAVKARIRLLQTMVMRHVKANALFSCETVNMRFLQMSQRLQFKPSTSEELVVLTEYAKSIDKARLVLENSMFSKGSVCELVKLVYVEGLPREFQRGKGGSVLALGPTTSISAPTTDDNQVATSGGAPRRSSNAGITDNEGLPFTRSQSAILKDALLWPEKIESDFLACTQVLSAEKDALQAKTITRVADFDKELADIRAGLDKLVNIGELKQTTSTVTLVTSLSSRLEKAITESEAINRQQGLLGLELTDYAPGIDADQLRLGPFERLWQLVSSFLACSKKWYQAPLSSNNAEEASKDGEALKISAVKCVRELPEEAVNPRALSQKIKEDLDRFLTADLPLLALLANPGLKNRHWEQMEGAVGFGIPHTAKSSLGDMLEVKLQEHVSKIEEFCVTASKEFSLEKALDRMEADWQPVTLDLKAYKTSGTHILSGASSDTAQGLLDDHIVKASTMAASRFAKALEGRIKEWVGALTEIQSVLDVWLKVQSTWLYLEPIFGSEDIMQQMPTEGARFKVVDETWRSIVKGAVADSRALKALRQKGQLAALTEAHFLLEQIQKGLNAYLESKRLIFPRFFFLSNDELLEILAETKDPTRVQPHLGKAFEGIASLEFTPDQYITDMYSQEGERVPFLPDPMIPGCKQINPADSKGNVEQWLLQVEAAMKRAVAKAVDDSMVAYPKAESRAQWATEWPGQAVLATTSTFWTYEVEEAIKAEGSKGLIKYGKKCSDQISEIIMRVRGKLSSMARKTLSALVTLDVHARDVTVAMGEEGVETIQDFSWNSQLRLYWTEGGESARLGKPASVTMKMINAVLQYAYEYLGNGSRLVVTPLTDRCYRTLMGAIHLGLGGAPEGPAGTGKTETTKDLAKAVAIQCVVFNCSDGLDYIAMGKFFKGLASSGAWACFDEFNRIELEVLSVVAQQVLTIQRAVRERKVRFLFEGTELNLRWTCCAFITMNPGYAGRSELPDNLKALFRSVAMMVPDYAMISEIMLYGAGYLDARLMGKKIVATYKLCSEQLSSQDHYDYGMRAVMAVLRAASNLKRAEGHLPEDVLVLRAIIDVNLPKFLAPDVPLFNSIVKDLFPGVVLPPPDRTKMVKCFTESAYDLQVQLLPNVTEKVLQIYEMMIVRHGFMLVGQPWSGKTSAARILQLSMGKLHEDFPEDPAFQDLLFVTLNPKSITMGQLYGQFDDLTHEWTDGVLATKFRDLAQNKIGDAVTRKWLIFDGPVDAVWIENMNTVLDDNKKLCLTSGEIISMSGVMSMVFEVADLAAASPATVSRCGMIYMEPAQLGWRPLVSSWLDHLMEDNPRFLFRAAHPNDKAAKERMEREEKEYYEMTEKAAEEEEAAKKAAAEGQALPKRKKTRASALNPNDKRVFTIDALMRAQIEGLITWLVEPCLTLLRRHPLHEYSPTQDATMVMTLMQVFEACVTQMVKAETAEGKPGYFVGALKMKGKVEPTWNDIENFFIYALVWSIGASTNEEGRAVFTEFLTNATKDPKYLIEHPLKDFMAIRGWHPPGEMPPAPPIQRSTVLTEEQLKDLVEAKPLLNPYNSMEDAKLKTALPDKGLLHDYFYNPTDGKWKEWTTCLPKEEISPTANYGDIIVPNIATAIFDYNVHLLITSERRILVCGPTGTGKSAYMKRMLLKTLPKDTYVPIFLAFSARTSAKATQAIMEQKLERRRKGVFGPPAGMRCTIFVDDLNMPEVEKYGAQPPIELLRQFCDQGGWYDLGENQFKLMEDALLVAAMGPPGGGRSAITARITRHFNLLCFTDFNEETMKSIFGTLVTWYMGKNPGFGPDIQTLGRTVVAATLDVYKAASKGLRPTPAKSHYTFNLRDFSRVIEGIFMVNPNTAGTAPLFTRAWLHETLRVFYDRLVTDDDRTWLLNTLKELNRKHFGSDFDSVCEQLITMHPGKIPGGPPATKGGKATTTIEHLRVLMWGDYMSQGTAPGMPRPYGEVTSIEGMDERMMQFLAEFNAQSKKPMDLVMFLFFMEHVSRISRIIKMPGGHGLLVGVGGSGRRCSANLAAFINEGQVFSIEISKSYGVTEWRDDIKKILKDAGTGQVPVCFVFVDTQIKWEGMLEDINAVLNSGEVPGLYAADEKADICEKMVPFARAAGMGKDVSPAELYAFFIERARRNLHILLCMSPIGDAFRDRLRKFPSLITCCTIDWFKAWPSDALTAVAFKSLKPLGLDETTGRSVVDVCQTFHQSAAHLSDDYLTQQRRYNYVTPTSYLELLSAFTKALELKRGEVSQARNRYVVGLEKLEFATQQVNTMSAELEALQPSLKIAQVETAELMKVIEARLPGVEEIRAVVSVDVAAANKTAAEVGAVKADCENDLAQAMPILENALASLDTITQNDITNIKSMQKPPENVKLVLAAICVMMGEKPERITDPNDSTKKIMDFWGPSKKLLGDNILVKLKTYDLDNIDPKRIAELRKVYIVHENFKPEIIAKSSSAAEGMCKWCCAMDSFERVAKDVEPKKAKLKEAEANLAITMAELKVKQDKLKAVEDELGALMTQLDGAKKKQDQLIFEVDMCQKKLVRASQLIGGLGGEKVRWAAAAEDLGRRYTNLTGDCLLASGVMAYLGAFTMEFRKRALISWVDHCLGAKIPCSIQGSGSSAENSEEKKGDEEEGDAEANEGEGGSSDQVRIGFSLATVLGDPILIRQWQIEGLPTDSFSTDNGIIVSQARRWPLMVDPQGQANKWVRNMEKTKSLIVCKLTDPGFLRTMENAIQFGRPVLLENVGTELDPALEPVLLKVVFKQGGVNCIRLGDSTVEYDERFKLYITTKLRNPHYLPETSTKVTIVNFMITPDGLADQLLGIVSAQERPDLEEEKNRLILQSAENNRQLKELEDKILGVLSNSKGNILEDESAIEILNSAKVLSNDIAAKQKIAAETEALIDETRMGYTPVAQHASRLFFCIADLGAIDPMYSYSMGWYVNIFINSIQNSKKSDNLPTRISNLNSYFTYSIYRNVCRSLFEKDKLLFAFLLTIAIMSGKGEVDSSEWFFLLTGGTAGENPHPNPAPAWLTDKSWGEIVRLSSVTVFEGLHEDVKANIGKWKSLYDGDAPHKADLPGKWGSMGFLTRMQKLLVLRTIRPDKLVLAIQEFVGAQLGQKFLQPPPFDLKACYEDGSIGQPMVFVLSAGSDPMAALLFFADSIKAKVVAVSLGQGQGPIAEALIEKSRNEGGWVVLQNCHLAVSWMPSLERIVENIAASEQAGIAAAKEGAKPPEGELKPPHPNFRLWCTSYPSAAFPVSILQNGIKMTNEPPKGIRFNIKRSYLSDPLSDPSFFNSVQNSDLFRRMAFALCFFHAICQERRYFGPLGWNIPYEFNDNDLRISVMQLAMFLDDPQFSPAAGAKATLADKITAVPYKHLRYLTGECNYGGKVTDGADRITLNSILLVSYTPELFEPGRPLSTSGEWKLPPPECKEYKQYLDYIDNVLPAVAMPEVFGLHDNANISKDQKEANALFESVLLTGSGGGGGGGGGGGSKKVKSKDEVIMEVATDILTRVRGEFDLEAVGAKWPNDPKESMNTVLIQELARYNRLISLVRSSMQNVQKAMKGLVVLSAALEGAANDLFIGRVPELWKGRSFSSRKPLASYISEFIDRLRILDEWIDKGAPPIFWISGFFFTQSFLTGAAQNYARKYVIPIDDVVFDPECMPEHINKDTVKRGPPDGVYVYGMYIEGCKWNYNKMALDESDPKVLFSAAPSFLLKPVRTADVRKFQSYNCPLFKTSDRRGVLATTGHSSNFVMRVPMPSNHNEHWWIRRGVCMLLSLDD